jgi:hypothetical protein
VSDSQKELNQVEDHKKMLLMTGNLSDFQLTNLKNWPFLLFDKELESVQVKYDFTKLVDDNEELFPGYVQYDFEFKLGTKLDRERTKMLLETLGLWVKFMFWKETRIEILKSGKTWEV